MFCTNCGASIVPGQKFCNKCGAPIDSAAVNVNNFMPQQQQMEAPSQVEAEVQPQMEVPVQAEVQPQMQAQPQMQVQQQMQAQPKKKKKWPAVLFIILFLALGAVAVGLVAYNAYKVFFVYSDQQTGEVFFTSDDLPDEPVIDEPVSDDINVEEGIDEDAISYEYAYVSDKGSFVRIVPNGTVNDDTVIWNDKTLGGFCDFVDSEVLSSGNKINRELLYQLVSIHVVDPSIVSDDHVFEILMKYSVAVCNEFGSTGVEIVEASFNKDTPNKYVYGVNVEGNATKWTIDYDNHKVLLNDGKTEYTSAGEYGMFTDKTMASWTYIIDQYFGIY